MIRTRVNRWKAHLGLDLPPSTGLTEALSWLMMARLGALSVALALAVLQQMLRREMESGPLWLLGYSLLAAGFLSTLLQGMLLEKMPERWWLAAVNVVFDSAIISIWIYANRGGGSVFALLYLVQILFVSLVYFQKGALLASGVGIGFFGVITILNRYENGFFIWSIYSALCLILGVIGGYLSEELRHTAKSLREESRKIEKLQVFHERIVSSMPTGLLSVDSGLTVNFVNPAGEHILGRLAREMVGKNLREVEPGFLPFFERIEMQDIVDSEMAGDSETTLSVTGTHQRRSFFAHPKADGGTTRLQQTVEIGTAGKSKIIRGDVAEFESDAPFGRMLQSHTGQKARVLLFQDVTKLRQLEEKLKQNEKMAAIGQLAAGIAHEIRNPLASMSASIEMLKRSIPPAGQGDENQRLMEIAIREIDRLNNLISEFLDFVKPSTFRREKVHLDKLLSELVMAIKNSRLFESRIRFRESYESDSVALGNSEKLKQVVWNLLVNAIDATKDIGTVEVGCCSASDQRVKFWVSDEGSGMNEEVMGHLYEPFFTTKEKGTGLGLATAYRIVEAHQGEIRVESKVKKGTRFEIYLPKA